MVEFISHAFINIAFGFTHHEYATLLAQLFYCAVNKAVISWMAPIVLLDRTLRRHSSVIANRRSISMLCA